MASAVSAHLLAPLAAAPLLRPQRRVQPAATFRQAAAGVRTRAAAAPGDDGPAPDRKGETLWRKELQGLDNLTAADFGSDLQQDIERLSERREVEKRLESYRSGRGDSAKAKSFVQDAVEKILVLDFFFILFILAWFLVGLGEKATLQSSGLIDAWLPLWATVFQPALGVFMAGALVSAFSAWTSKK